LLNVKQAQLMLTPRQADNLRNTKTSTTALADKTNKITTNKSTTAWSPGLASDRYHSLDTGSDALVIRTPSGAISANLLRNVGGATYDGRAMFCNMLGDLRFGSRASQKTSYLFY
jgi:hypothetical protein